MRLEGKTAIVTGAGSGIGRAIAIRFAREGAQVVIAEKNEASIPAVVEEIRAAGGRADGHPLDVTQRDQVHALMRDVAARHERIDILVNNAGITRYRPFASMTGDDWDLVLDVDLKGVFFCIQAAAPYMTAQRYGRVVNISSSLGTGTTPHNTGGSPGGSSAYAAAKAGVIMLTKTMARELGPSGITVNAVAPGTFLTGMSSTTRTPEEVEAHLEFRRQFTLLRRLGTLEELAASVLFLASDEAGYITGTTLQVDGGRADRL